MNEKRNEIENENKDEKNKAIAVDQISKLMFSRADVLAEFVRHVIPELRGYSMERIAEEIRNKKDYPRGLNTENVLPGLGIVRYDLLYRIPVPDSGREVNVLVNIETQSSPDPEYETENRTLFYLASIYASQKGEVFRHSDYDSLEPVYGIWIVLRQPKHLRGKVMTGGFNWRMDGADTGRRSMINGILLYLNDEDAENPLPSMDLVGMLLRRNNRDTIARDVKERFNIDLDDGYIREVNRMGEIAEGFIRAGREEGMEEGRARLVSMQTEAVINFMGLGKSLEEAVALAHVPDDCIDEVREAVLERMGRASSRDRRMGCFCAGTTGT